jgi:hypothetical protein
VKTDVIRSKSLPRVSVSLSQGVRAISESEKVSFLGHSIEDVHGKKHGHPKRVLVP